MAKKVNFTKEHLKELHGLFVRLSFGKKALNGKFNANQLSPYDLLHSTSVDTLISMRGQLKKEIEAFDNDHDEFTATESQNRQNNEKKVWERYLYLLIGYKRYLTQKAADADKLRKAEAEYKALEEETMTPKEKLKAKKKELDALKGVEDVELEDDFTEV
jgi:DNA repair ATPase RecN